MNCDGFNVDLSCQSVKGICGSVGDFRVFSRTFHLFEDVAKGADLSSRPVDLGKVY